MHRTLAVAIALLAIAVTSGGSALANKAPRVPSLRAGKRAISHFAQEVARESGATRHRVSGCARGSSSVRCAVRWDYPKEGVFCKAEAAAHYAGPALKVRVASPIACDSLPS